MTSHRGLAASSPSLAISALCWTTTSWCTRQAQMAPQSLTVSTLIRSFATGRCCCQRHGWPAGVILGAAAPRGLLPPSWRRAGALRILGLTPGHETWWARLPVTQRLLRRIGDSCDHLSTISSYAECRVAGALSPSARRRLLRLAPPVDIARFRPPEQTAVRSGARCIAVARLIPQKGMSTLLRAWRTVIDRDARRGVDHDLIVVGD